MNLRCLYCQTPFTLNRAEMLNGIVAMNEKHQTHYDAHCPRCRRANPIARQRMELFYPHWQEDAAKMKAGLEAAVAAPPAPKQDAITHLPTEPISKSKAVAAKKAAAKPATAAKKPSAGKKPADSKKSAAKPATAKKPAAKKPAATKKK